MHSFFYALIFHSFPFIFIPVTFQRPPVFFLTCRLSDCSSRCTWTSAGRALWVGVLAMCCWTSAAESSVSCRWFYSLTTTVGFTLRQCAVWLWHSHRLNATISLNSPQKTKRDTKSQNKIPVGILLLRFSSVELFMIIIVQWKLLEKKSPYITHTDQKRR